jgi:hypothetical protein
MLRGCRHGNCAVALLSDDALLNCFIIFLRLFQAFAGFFRRLTIWAVVT